MTGLTAATVGLAFSAGLLASVNPCGFAMLPSMVSFYLGQGQEDYAARPLWRRAGEGLRLGGLVTAGFLVVFVLAGVLISLGAGTVARFFPWATVGVGVALIVLGMRLYLGGALPCHCPTWRRRASLALPVPCSSMAWPMPWPRWAAPCRSS